MKDWLKAHAALTGAIVASLVNLSGALPHPYDQVVGALAIILAALSGGPQPPLPRVSR